MAIEYMTGNIFDSDAEALVNTVNCEGYMGKGIAYQFKLRYPENNEDYVRVCKRAELRPGMLHWFEERGKVIINFPTKDRWREKSQISYIEDGLDALMDLIGALDIRSIAIPPLGSGNGGLDWRDVRRVIAEKLKDLGPEVAVSVYEPSRNYAARPVREPKLGFSELILMELKQGLERPKNFRLQKAAYFADLFAKKSVFKFVPYKYGPYDHAIDIASRSIAEFQSFHGVSSTDEAKHILYGKISSAAVDRKLAEAEPCIARACSFVNGIQSDHMLECMATICYIVEHSCVADEESILNGFREWSYGKADRFFSDEVHLCIAKLEEQGMIERVLTGYRIPVAA